MRFPLHLTLLSGGRRLFILLIQTVRGTCYRVCTSVCGCMQTLLLSIISWLQGTSHLGIASQRYTRSGIGSDYFTPLTTDALPRGELHMVPNDQLDHTKAASLRCFALTDAHNMSTIARARVCLQTLYDATLMPEKCTKHLLQRPMRDS